jgi:uncharacterized protein (DUF433 family)
VSGEQHFREADPSLVADQNLLSRITFDPAKCGGRPCIRHYRLRVSDVLDTLAGGASVAEVLADYPFLEADDIRACLAYASSQIDHPMLTGSA